MKLNEISKVFVQILQNQRHILRILNEMHRNGKVSSGLYCSDDAGEELSRASSKLIEKLEGK